jgi:hypothetical protein
MRLADLPLEQHRRAATAEDISLDEVRGAIDHFLRLHEELSDSRSSLGGQIDALQLGLVSSPDETAARRAFSSESRHLHRGVWLGFWLHQISDEERTVVVYKQTPLPLTEIEDVAAFAETNALILVAGNLMRVRKVRTGDLEYVRRRGGEVIGTRDPRLDYHDPAAHAEEGTIFVREPAMIFPSHKQAAEVLGITPRQVRTRLESAYHKVRIFLSEGK